MEIIITYTCSINYKVITLFGDENEIIDTIIKKNKQLIFSK